MILGLAAGRWLRASRPGPDAPPAFAGGADRRRTSTAFHGNLPDREADLDAGLDAVQRRDLFLVPGAFCWVIEVKGARRWAFPLVVIGMNSIAAYLIAQAAKTRRLDGAAAV